MSVSREQFDHIARLARLSFSDAEAEALGAQLNRIIEFVDALARVDTTDVEPFDIPTVDSASLRPDEAHAPLPADAALRNAPASAEGYFTVPKALGTQGGGE
ncbi:MAG: Asp-tRNA(Asn)/Glu-tRNA(Gln) amidotransferase subunit GatC [Ignavibacteriae bacterium]|nr:Asp-tRNA(Asn)/Glu-tRNA(Gln) amidotransferase subunit GatC [Ignavibacteriota bacterium]